MSKKIFCNNISELDFAAHDILQYCNGLRIFLIYGEMGIGKTTLIKALCKRLGVKDIVNSPTFSIVNEYRGDEPVFHMDFYRIRNETEPYDIGYEEYFNQGCYCFVEWPSKIEHIIPANSVKIYITGINGKRTMEILKP